MASPYYRCPNCHNVSRKNDNMFEMVEMSGSNTVFAVAGGAPCPDCGVSHNFDDIYLHPKYDVPIEDVYGGKAGVDLQLIRRAHAAGRIRLSEQELALLKANLPAAAAASPSKANASATTSAQTTTILSYWLPIGAIVILSAVFYYLNPLFADTRTLLNILFPVAINSLIACAMTYLIGSGDIDLSPGAVMAWASMLFGVMMVNWGWPWALALVVVVLQAALVHTIFGVIRVAWQAPAFLVTLALATILSGLARAINEGGMILFPEAFALSGASAMWLLVAFVAVLALIFHLVGTKTGVRRWINQTSTNTQPLRLFSPAGRVRIGVFALSGAMAALAGVLYSFRLRASLPTVGQGVEIAVIAAVLLGGGRLFGGSGSIPGALLWLTVFAIIDMGLNLVLSPPQVRWVIRGLILSLAVMAGMLPQVQQNRDRSST